MNQRNLQRSYASTKGGSLIRWPRKLTIFLAYLFVNVSLLAGASVVGADNGKAVASATPWWQVVSGILAIPITLLGGYYTWKQIRNMKKPKTVGTGITVANGAVFKNSNVNGDLVGIKSTGSSVPEFNQNIEVLNQARVEDTRIGGDVAGVKHQSEKPEVNADKRRTNTP